ncbi:hypothetical protein ADK55_18625 [Streptomyces sp. WM4235]|uniref:hypothetical protein n=1 Tax=Streptomyces sp. WM4235 TaxID=1415551 RepID=UPI0006AFD602|nr:hypothetical protein [Streptomyces sp. WM4235]KOU50558.1 hypothetical protein ADK55_18625 [Streptomyces sp. WM4235]
MSAPSLAITEEHRAEGLATRVLDILADPANPSRRSLPAYRFAALRAFETAAASADQPTACDWCGQSGSDPIEPQDGE